ncbi:hypothetical protein ACH0BE_21690 [Bacillus subtilis]|uniref:hypothetical protein n=1 Tax=Bacillus subtilis TaxID=1423 RepID=UPI00387A4074
MYYYYPQYQLVPIPCDYRYYPQNHHEDYSEEPEFRPTFNPDTFITASIQGIFETPKRIYIRKPAWQGGKVRVIYASGGQLQAATVNPNRIEITYEYSSQPSS